MTESTPMPPDVETPVNPYSLLEAVNASSDTAHTGWLIFLGIMTYFMIAVAGVTHKDLLLETPVELPILQVKIQLTQFFQFAPLILVLLHLGLIAQLVLLARKTIEFDNAIRLLETTDRRSHPLRLELHNFFFVQAIAGPHRSRVMSGFLHAMSWLTLVVLPVVLILYIQVVFLPYHDITITWMHRVILLADIGMLILIGVFLTRTETSFFTAFWRTTMAHPWSFIATTVVLAVVTLFSFFAATVPGEMLDRMTQTAFGTVTREMETGERRYEGGFMLPFLGAGSDGSMFGIFRRNLDVTDTDLVLDTSVNEGEPALSLRGRDLRFARLDRSDLHQADLTGSDLDEASLVGTDLHDAWLQCADFEQLVLSEDRAAARCASARRADLRGARLDGARMSNIDLRQANLTEARLEGAELAGSLLIGADFSGAKLDKADLKGVQAQGVDFPVASLQGADLNGAQLQLANFTRAAMQGAILNHAHLEGATLLDADLEAASLSKASLQGANLSGARIAGTDLRGATVWMTKPPKPDPQGFSDFGGLLIKPLDQKEVVALTKVFDRLESDRLRYRVRDTLAPLFDAGESKRWHGSPEQQGWQTIAAAPQPVLADEYATGLTEYLASLVCKARWKSGGLATGVARRALAADFRGNIVVLYDRLKSNECAASESVLPSVTRDLSAAAEVARNE